ncbi:hypothetical protein E3N88_13665 [Mikania micrantha]|uniref:Uncharacterized protein n=1 Tax=Mikania micrantha TaxID=192012 RepID=A0A5N6P2A1_9ASTR|nr:hypothetical protein E3N88_13665 [Mikania micrantha]
METEGLVTAARGGACRGLPNPRPKRRFYQATQKPPPTIHPRHLQVIPSLLSGYRMPKKKLDTFRGKSFRCEIKESLEAEMEDNVEHPEDRAEIGLNAILGNSHPTTMKVPRMLNSTKVLILLDGGSMHNFISDVLVKELTLPTQNIRHLTSKSVMET